MPLDLTNTIRLLNIPPNLIKLIFVSKQAGAELGQAQLKLGLDFTLLSSDFGFSRFGSIVLVVLI